MDKYVGDGILAQFLEGNPRGQATAALRAVTSINDRLAEMNAIRIKNRMTPIRLVTSLHAGICAGRRLR